jgi:hypothetical protein
VSRRCAVAVAGLVVLAPLAVAHATPRAAHTYVFNGQGNDLAVYDAATGEKRILIRHNDGQGLGPALDGERDLNAQICFDTFKGSTYFIGGEDTLQGAQSGTDPGLAGWGWFKLTGHDLGSFAWEEKGKLVPSYNADSDFNENYGCGFTKEHNLLLADVGDQQFEGSGTGQLHLWFRDPQHGFGEGYDFDPTAQYPFHAVSSVPYCKLDTGITTAGQVLVQPDGSVLIASARPDLTDPIKGWGIFRYDGLPTTDPGCDADGLLGGKTLLDAGRVTKSLFLLDPVNTPTPNAIISDGQGGYYVSSVFNGVIAQYDARGLFQRRVLGPAPTDGPIPPLLADGVDDSPTPLGIGLAPDGRLWFADIAIGASDPQSIGPVDGRGTVRWVDTKTADPLGLSGSTTVDHGLDYPDGIGILTIR